MARHLSSGAASRLGKASLTALLGPREVEDGNEEEGVAGVTRVSQLSFFLREPAKDSASMVSE